MVYLSMEMIKIYETLLNLPSLKITEVILKQTKINIICEINKLSGKCPICHQESSTINQYYVRKLRDLNISDREVYLKLQVRQFYCKSCGKHFSEQPDFANENKSHTDRQTDFMFLIGSKQSYTESALILNTNPKTVERIILSVCKKTADVALRYKEVRRLGIDEQSHQKGKKKYICVLTDLDKGIIVDIVESRKKEHLLTHFETLGQDFCAQITDVSCDNWKPYISVATTCFTKAKIILDRFHVTKSLNDCLDTFRKEIRKAFPANESYKQLKWLLCKQYHTLSDEQLDHLKVAFESSPELKELYFTREKFHHILDNTQVIATAVLGLDNWINEVKTKKLTIFDTFVKTLKSTKIYVANYVENNLSNAVTEGLNNLIRSIRRTAFGMPNFQNLRWRALAISI